MKKPICVRKCCNCNKDVEIFHRKRAERNLVFCCEKCKGEYRKKHRILNAVCPICGKRFHIKPNKLKDGLVHCCSMDCSKELRRINMSGEKNHQYGLRGPLNDSFRGGRRINSGGYIIVYAPGNPFRDSDDYVLEHRLVAEKYLLNDENSIIINGERFLKPEYVVHHIDGNRQNNDPSNLQVLTRGEHTSLHIRKNK